MDEFAPLLLPSGDLPARYYDIGSRNDLGERLSAAIRRQRPVLKALLGAAQVSVRDADEILVDALLKLSWEEWAKVPELDAEILVLVNSRCASYARERGIRFVGLGRHPRKAARKR